MARLSRRPGRHSSVFAPLALVALSAVLPLGALADFHRGDIVPSSRRAQFHGSRTQWHDLLARHCPRFAVDSVVAVPIPKPLSFRPTDAYKIMLAFDHDRHLTEWLPLISPETTYIADTGDGRRRPAFEVPMLDVAFEHAHGELRTTRAKAVEVSKEYLVSHADLVDEFRNASLWPKHLLVRYRWSETPDVDEGGELSFALGVGVVLLAVSLWSACGAYGGEMTEFVDRMAAEDDRRAATEGRFVGAGARGGGRDEAEARDARGGSTSRRDARGNPKLASAD